ncbi:MAG: nitrilase-related carbon-nitrogen hydrolase [bacterium]
MRKIKLALVQCATQAGEIDRNRKLAQNLIQQAAGQGAQLVCLPELFTTAHDFDLIRAQSQAHGTAYGKSRKCRKTPGTAPVESSPVAASGAASNPEDVDWLAEMACSLKIHLLAGTIPEKDHGRFYNTAFFFNDQGKVLGKYRKVHLFPPMGEDTFFSPGLDCPVFDTPLARVGVCICYDLRFPVQFADLAARGADIILVPARFPHPRLEHWQILIRARAIENYLFTAGCNCTGTHSRQVFCGHSCIISPWGETLTEAKEREEVVMAEIDLDLVQESRSFFQRRNG